MDDLKKIQNKFIGQIGNFDINPTEFKMLMTYYECAILEVKTKLDVLNKEFSANTMRNPIASIKTRIKSPDSIYEKLDRKNLDKTLESVQNNLDDVAGIRIICSFLDDIYSVADMLTSQDDVKELTRKDYIKNPKPNGYRSLHLIIEIPIFLKDEKKDMRVEVQLRTIAMDFWASLDHKLSYKKDIPEEEAKLLRQELLECAQISADLDVRTGEIKNRIVNKENT